MCGKGKRDSTENIFSELKILKFTDINAYYLADSCINAIRKMYLEYSVISSNVIVLSMVMLRDKVNIYMYPWKEVISLSFAYVTAV